jgi:uncharacterized protein (DUF488 family)
MTVFTIGHSNHEIATFIDILKQHGVTAIADVRSSPYSRRFPQFQQKNLQAALKIANIAYVFLGDRLGARPQDQSCYVEGVARYDLIAATAAFTEGLNRLTKGAEKYQLSLMCAEQDPIGCHRAILICPHLQNLGLEIQHICKHGELETHQCLENRLLKLHHLDKFLAVHQDSQPGTQLTLFDMNTYDANAQELAKYSPNLCRKELLEKAYQLQGERIAYVEEKSMDEE